MNEFDIFVDSSANLPDKLRVERNIKMISYRITVNGQERLCFDENVPFTESAKAFYAEVRAGADVKSSLVSEENFITAVTPSLQAGKDVLILTIASGISGTYQQALKAQKALQTEFPERTVVVKDSANASLGQGMLALKVADLRDMGETIETCANWLDENTYKMNSYLTVGDLKYMRKSGRISMPLAIAGALLNIKPILKADGGEVAKIVFSGKEHGRKKALSAIAAAFAERAIPLNQTVAIAHADCEEDALALAAAVKSMGASDVIIEYYDLCTGGHIGPGTVALFFMGKDRRGEAFDNAPVPAGAKVAKAKN